jgi:Rieske 2Fe-2S family protein
MIGGHREPLARVEPGLPSAWYHDAAHYARELDVFWYRRWIAVARATELDGPGAFRVVTIGTQSIVIVRGGDGALRAFHNTCRHRGSILCTEEAGRLRDGHVRCPFHAWTYDLEGRLIATPRRMPTPDFDPANFSLFEVLLACWGGFVFVNLARETAAPLLDTLGEMTTRFASYPLDRLVVGKRVVADVRANWKLVAENFAECLHCPPVHPELCAIVTAYRDGGAWGLRRDAGGQPVAETSPEYRPGVRTLTLDGTARLPPFEGLGDTERATPYVPWMLPPNLYLNVHPDYVNAHLVFPTGPESVRIVYDWLFEAERMPLSDDDLEHYVALWRITNAQDAQNCEWQQAGLHSRTFAHGVYMPQEFDCAKFDDWVRAELSKQ